jgi:hypothetical protein
MSGCWFSRQLSLGLRTQVNVGHLAQEHEARRSGARRRVGGRRAGVAALASGVSGNWIGRSGNPEEAKPQETALLIDRHRRSW